MKLSEVVVELDKTIVETSELKKRLNVLLSIDTNYELSTKPEEEQLKVVKHNPGMIKYILTPSKDVLALADKLIKRINTLMAVNKKFNISLLTEEQQQKKLKSSSEHFQYMIDPTENIINFALLTDGDVIRFIENPNEEMKQCCIRESGDNYALIKDPSDQVKLIALKTHPHIIGLIDDPTEEMQLLAVEKNTKHVRFIKNPSRSVQLKVLGHSISNIEYFQTLCFEAVVYYYEWSNNKPIEGKFLSKLTDVQLVELALRNT
jgi:hypothetical protein